jgi:hypothetical protein
LKYLKEAGFLRIIFFYFSDSDVSPVDSGYCAHASLTVDLVRNALKKYALPGLNTWSE